MKPKQASWQNLQEKASLLAVEGKLSPWRCTWIDGRDDFGRDGLVQVLTEQPDGTVVAAPLTFFAQVKSSRDAFGDRHAEELETAHLDLWAGTPAPTVVAVWCAPSGQIRYRTIVDIIAEVSSRSPNWRTQRTVTVDFRREHLLTELGTLERAVRDDADQLGGVDRFHKTRRRVFVTDLYAGTVRTSAVIGMERSDGQELVLTVGAFWEDGDLDPEDVFAERVLAGALILYEEVWFTYEFIGVISNALPPAEIAKLLLAKRLVPVALGAMVGFVRNKPDRRGTISTFSKQNDPLQEALRFVKKHLAGKDPTGALYRAMESSLRVMDTAVAPTVERATNADLSSPVIRDLLGLGQSTGDRTQSRWDQAMIGRLVHVNTAMAIAQSAHLDVVEYEAGLSRVASEKWFDKLRHNRAATTSESFDELLRRTGVPDVGILCSLVGLSKVIELADSRAGQEFRDWFWEEASLLLSAGGDVATALSHKLHASYGTDPRASKLTSTLRLAFCEAIGAPSLVGTAIPGVGQGFSSRSTRGSAVLRRQRHLHSKRRAKQIAIDLCGVPGTYDRCPCGSEAKFRFCCGRDWNK